MFDLLGKLHRCWRRRSPSNYCSRLGHDSHTIHLISTCCSANRLAPAVVVRHNPPLKVGPIVGPELGGRMARTRNKLTARTLASLSKPGKYSDGGGLYLRIDGEG